MSTDDPAQGSGSQYPPPAGMPAGPAYPGPAPWGQAPPGQVAPGPPPGAGWTAPTGAGPAARSGLPVLVIVLAAIAAVALINLGLGVVFTGYGAIQREDRIAQLKASKDGQLRQDAGEKRRRRSEFEAVDLYGKFVALGVKTTAYRVAEHQWVQRGKKNEEMYLLQDSEKTCMAARLEYDYLAARYSDLLPTNLPRRIDPKDGDHNCWVEDFGSNPGTT